MQKAPVTSVRFDKLYENTRSTFKSVNPETMTAHMKIIKSLCIKNFVTNVIDPDEIILNKGVQVTWLKSCQRNSWKVMRRTLCR